MDCVGRCCSPAGCPPRRPWHERNDAQAGVVAMAGNLEDAASARIAKEIAGLVDGMITVRILPERRQGEEVLR